MSPPFFSLKPIGMAEPEPPPLPLAAAEASPAPAPAPAPLAPCESSSPEIFTYDHDLVTELQMKCIITANLPWNIFDSDGFTETIQECLQPAYERVSYTTLKRLAVKHYSQAKKDLIQYFQNQNTKVKVSLTIHQWKTSGGYYNVPFTCLTCHWIDHETWKMSKRIIGLYQFQLELYDVILPSISEFCLKDKILSISVDDSDGFYTSDMKVLEAELNPMFDGVFFHTKCVCYILNSMVKSCLDFVDPIVTKFEKLLRYALWDHEKEFRKFVRSKGVKFSHLGLSFLDDWNTTYKMLSGMVKQKSILVQYYATCGDGEIDVTDSDWETIESLLGILKVFHSSTVRLSDSYYPTSPLVLEEILLITHMFKAYKQNPFWQPVILEMEDKLFKYYETMPQVFTCGAALNPKIGIGGVENILHDIVGYLGLDTNNMNDGDYAEVSMTKCSDALHQVFDCYDKMYRSRGSERNEMNDSGSRNLIMESVSRKKSRCVMISNELELYMKTDFVNCLSCDEYESFNVLEWWKNKGCHQYPILAEMARDILTVQASTMALEFAFCLNGRVLDEETSWKMSQLSSPKMYEIRIFLKEHYFDANEGNRNVNLVEDGDESEDDDLFFDSSDEEEMN